MNVNRIIRNLGVLGVLLALAPLSGCGGGGGNAQTPIPTRTCVDFFCTSVNCSPGGCFTGGGVAFVSNPFPQNGTGALPTVTGFPSTAAAGQTLTFSISAPAVFTNVFIGFEG